MSGRAEDGQAWMWPETAKGSEQIAEDKVGSSVMWSPGLGGWAIPWRRQETGRHLLAGPQGQTELTLLGIRKSFFFF